MDDGEDVTSRQRERTVAVMRSTVEQLQLAAQILGTTATASPDPATAIRLQALADDVSAQAKDIWQRADQLAGDDGQRADQPTGDDGGRRADHSNGGDCGGS